MNTYFNINYEFDVPEVHRRIEQQVQSGEPGYICVADGVILNTANRDASYLNVVNSSMFSICDSSYVPLYLKWIYGAHYQQYCGFQIFMDIVRQRKYRMFFLGTTQDILDALRDRLVEIDPRIADMTFYALPYCSVNDFDYPAIARMVNDAHVDIVWVSLGAPKQEIFMNKLLPHLSRGVMIAVGAAFKFYSGLGERRAPDWMLRNHMEFIYRIYSDPKKQIKRCAWIVRTLPSLLWQENRRKHRMRLDKKEKCET